ncbi:MAG: hypothetical protein EOP67_26515, partial [Sphingomonas sp.]
MFDPSASERYGVSPRDAAAKIRTGIICNPKSHRNRSSVEATKPFLSGTVLAVTPRTQAELAEVLTDFARHGIELLVIDGGDGTIRDVMTAAARVWTGAAPRVAIVPSGKTNALALDLGIPDDWTLDQALTAARFESDPHPVACAPRTVRAPEQGLEDRPAQRETDRDAVEGAGAVGALRQRGRVDERARTQQEAVQTRTGILADDLDRAADLDVAGARGGQRLVERPAIGDAEIERERVGLARGHDRHAGGCTGPHARGGGHHVADRAVAAVDHQQFDAVAREIGQHFGEFSLRARRHGQHGARQERLGRLDAAAVAVAFRVADDARTDLRRRVARAHAVPLGCRRIKHAFGQPRRRRRWRKRVPAKGMEVRNSIGHDIRYP